MKKILLLLFICISTMMFAEGAGGVMYGTWTNSALFSSSAADVEFIGAYGYGVNSDGFKTGGFGLMLSEEVATDNYSFTGAFGGLISGYQFGFDPVYIGIDLWTGIGYTHDGTADYYDYNPETQGVDGLTVLGMVSAEVGVQVFKWMAVGVVGGMQVLLPISELRHFEEGVSTMYSPFVALKISWGSF